MFIVLASALEVLTTFSCSPYIQSMNYVFIRKSRWPRREIDLPELFTPRTEELLAVIKAAGPLDVLCLQEFSTDPRVVDMFNDALGSK